MFFKLAVQAWRGLHILVMITSIDLSQEIFTTDMLTALKPSLEHRGKRGGQLPNKGRYGCGGPGIRYFRDQFLPGHQVLGGKICQALGIWQFFTKKCVIFDKSVKKVTYLLNISNFGTLKFMTTCPVIRFLGTFARALGFLGKFCPA